ncbi:MAG: DnaJ C-terminal domain-containing protein [Bdellovibrionales bacterium]
MATKDPYQTLGVPKSASAEEIKRAFRELAKKHHPDRNRGDKAAETKFKDINAAYDILGDEAKRRRFDRGEIDAQGNERAYTSAGAGGFQGGGFANNTNFRDFNFNFGGGARDKNAAFSAEDLFADLFGGMRSGNGGGGKKSRGPFEHAMRGKDIAYDLKITLFEAVRGGKRRITLANNKTIDVAIPPATTDGQTLRLKGVGDAGRGGAQPGDALVTLKIEPHAHFTLKGLNLHIEIPVTLYEAVLGAEIKVPTLDGTAMVKVPKGSNSGTQLRLKGKGAAKGGQTGDQYCTLKVVLPEKADADLTAFTERWAKKHPYDVRKKLF